MILNTKHAEVTRLREKQTNKKKKTKSQYLQASIQFNPRSALGKKIGSFLRIEVLRKSNSN